MSARIDPSLQQVLSETATIEAASRQWNLPEVERRRLISELSSQRLPPLKLRGMQRTDCYVAAPGREIPVRLYRSARAPERPPLMAYFHGGGWVAGSIATHDSLCAEIAERTGYMVASVHYRRAPESPYPAQHEDTWEAVAWLARHAAQLGADPQRPMALGGDSAGAHLALGCARRAGEEAPGRVDRMLLFYPCVDPDLASESAHALGEGPGLTRAAMQYFWQALLGELSVAQAAGSAALPLTWPADLRLPPTVLVTAEIDLLRDEGDAYARRLQEAGVHVVHWRAEGMIHGFARMLTASVAARRHVRRACQALAQIGQEGQA